MLACVKPVVKEVVEQQNADLSKRSTLDEVLACAISKSNLEENADLSKRSTQDEVLACAINKSNLKENMVFMQVSVFSSVCKKIRLGRRFNQKISPNCNVYK